MISLGENVAVVALLALSLAAPARAQYGYMEPPAAPTPPAQHREGHFSEIGGWWGVALPTIAPICASHTYEPDNSTLFIHGMGFGMSSMAFLSIGAKYTKTPGKQGTGRVMLGAAAFLHAAGIMEAWSAVNRPLTVEIEPEQRGASVRVSLRW